MSTFKKAEVILLPTNEVKGDFSKERIYPCLLKYSWMFDKEEKGKLIFAASNIRTPTQLQNLYIISDDEIKEGDWFLSDSRGTKQEPPKYMVEQCIKVENGWIFGHIEGMEAGHNPDWSKRIIATTDKSLEISNNLDYNQLLPNRKNFRFYLPQPSQQFIQKFVEEYNKGNVITDILVEYEYLLDDMVVLPYWKLKVNAKDNTITIKKLKETYTKEELCQVLEKYTSFIWSEVGIHYPISLGIDTKEKFINNEL